MTELTNSKILVYVADKLAALELTRTISIGSEKWQADLRRIAADLDGLEALLNDDKWIEKVATERAERVCNGQFPVEYSREKVVMYTKDDFIAGAKSFRDRILNRQNEKD